MKTLTVEYPKDLKQHIGVELGPSEWMTVDQAMIDKFADATGDHQWIHVDVERAKREMPGGKTIAHGYLTLSLLPLLLREVFAVQGARMGINYGVDRIRFTAPVPSGSRVRALARLLSTERRGEGVLCRLGVTVEIEGGERPACVGEVLSLVYA